MEQQIVVFDLHRMLFGDEPPLFLFEIGFRTLVIYTYTLFLLRWLGSRTVGQLSTVEFLLVIALGSAVGDAMFYPDVPLLHAIIVVTIVVIANKMLDVFIATNRGAEKVIDGEPREVVRDGVVTHSFFMSKTISRDELFQQLREKGIEQLGEVWRAYIEKDGQLTLFKTDSPLKGLRIVPPPQVEPYLLIDPALRQPAGPVVCAVCGRNHSGTGACENCDGGSWTISTDRKASD